MRSWVSELQSTCVHVYPSLLWALARCLLHVAVPTYPCSQTLSEISRRPRLKSDKNKRRNWQAVSILYVTGLCVHWPLWGKHVAGALKPVATSYPAHSWWSGRPRLLCSPKSVLETWHLWFYDGIWWHSWQIKLCRSHLTNKNVIKEIKKYTETQKEIHTVGTEWAYAWDSEYQRRD